MYQITSRFGERESFRNHAHNGIDLALPNGTEIKSIRDGIVTEVVNQTDSIGRGVIIKFNNGHTAIYGHMSDTNVSPGDYIHSGELLGHSGNTGHVEGVNGGYHLHFGIKEDGSFIDPSSYVNDIQHMNDVQSLVECIPTPNISFTDFASTHFNAINEIFSQIKLNFILPLLDNVFLMQKLQYTFQFFATHASFLNNIITSLF